MKKKEERKKGSNTLIELEERQSKGEKKAKNSVSGGNKRKKAVSDISGYLFFQVIINN